MFLQKVLPGFGYDNATIGKQKNQISANRKRKAVDLVVVLIGF
jgi:hypothetical protein